MLFPSNSRGDTERSFFVVDAAYIAVQLHVQSQDLIVQSCEEKRLSVLMISSQSALKLWAVA